MKRVNPTYRMMITNRCIDIAKHVIETGCTVREAASKFNVSKSTVHKDLRDRLYDIDSNLYYKVEKVLDYNRSVRHLRGGEATQLKYNKLKNS